MNSRKSFRNYLISTTLLMGLLSFYIPIRYETPYPRDLGPQFDPYIRRTYIDLLNEQEPVVFLLGDSMLGDAVDEQELASRLNRKTISVSLPGTASTIWYLIIKNNIVLAEHKPEYLIVAFRDSMMTLPGYRVTGRYFEQIDEFASPDDKLLIQRAYINQLSPPEKFMERYIPLYGSRRKVHQTIDYYLRYTLGRVVLNCWPVCMDDSMQGVFGDGNLDVTFLSDAVAAADDYLYTKDVLIFDRQIERSFLPEIIRLCRENNIQLVLVRMPTQRFQGARSKSEGLDAYIKDLSTYLSEKNVELLDFDRAKNLPNEYFEDEIHLNERGREAFTKLLAESMVKIVK